MAYGLLFLLYCLLGTDAVKTRVTAQQAFDPMSIVTTLLQSILGVGGEMNALGASEEAAKAALEDQLRDQALADAAQNGTALPDLEALTKQQAEMAELERRAREGGNLGVQATMSLAKALEESQKSLTQVQEQMSNATEMLKKVKDEAPPPLTDRHEPGVIRLTVKYPVHKERETQGNESVSPSAVDAAAASAIQESGGDPRQVAKLNLNALKVPVIALIQDPVTDKSGTERILDSILYHLEKYPASETARKMQKNVMLTTAEKIERLNTMIALMESRKAFFVQDQKQAQRLLEEAGRGDEVALILDAARAVIRDSESLGAKTYLAKSDTSSD